MKCKQRLKKQNENCFIITIAFISVFPYIQCRAKFHNVKTHDEEMQVSDTEQRDFSQYTIQHELSARSPDRKKNSCKDLKNKDLDINKFSIIFVI